MDPDMTGQIALEAVDRSSPVPFYLQVIEILREKIEAGEWETGHQLPSETELCDLLNVSRAVIRQALQSLAYEGFVIREQGKGTFVVTPKMRHRPSTLISFSRHMRSQGHVVRTRVLDQRIVPAMPKVVRHLGLIPGDDVVYVHRLRMVEARPVAIHKAFLPLDPFEPLVTMDLTGSLWDAISRISGIGSAFTRDVIEATLVKPEEAQLLDCQVGRPALLMSGVAYDIEDSPFRYTIGLYRADALNFTYDGDLVSITFEG
jgi:GntR family transcriptional regulator